CSQCRQSGGGCREGSTWSAGIPAGEVVAVETRPHGRRRSQEYRFANSGDFNLHLLDLVLDVPVARVLAKGAKVRISGQPLEIAIAEGEGLFQGGRGQIEITIERVTASQVVI